MYFNIEGIYILFDEIGDILYIGKTKNLYNTIQEHLLESWKSEIYKVYIRECKNEADKDILEIQYISRHKPKYNTNKIYDKKSTIKIKSGISTKYLISEIINS